MKKGDYTELDCRLEISWGQGEQAEPLTGNVINNHVLSPGTEKLPWLITIHGLFTNSHILEYYHLIMFFLDWGEKKWWSEQQSLYIKLTLLNPSDFAPP